ncbi:MAG: transposase [Flavobacteriales bacterium]|nr:transposase [Flavobacteriales bacterium]
MRKRGHDHASPGLYFVTFCTNERHPWFGRVINGKVELNDSGCIAHDHWNGIPGHHAHVEVHAFTIMPDHIHGIIELTGRPARVSSVAMKSGRPQGAPSGSLGAIVGAYRAGVVREMNRVRPYTIRNLWQRGYHDIIIRNDRMLERITRYIRRHPRMLLPEHWIRIGAWIQGDVNVAPTSVRYCPNNARTAASSC